MSNYPRSPLRFMCVVGIVCLSFSLANAQHDSTGGPTAGGGALGGPTKPATKPATKPSATGTTKPASTRKPPVAAAPRKVVPKTPTTPTGLPTADFYVKQGDTEYDAKNYNDALQSYLKAVQLNPSLATRALSHRLDL